MRSRTEARELLAVWILLTVGCLIVWFAVLYGLYLLLVAVLNWWLP